MKLNKQPNLPGESCPHCGHTGPSPRGDSTGDDFQPFARVGSVAEAGYYLHLLTEAGVAASARSVENFSAATGQWMTAFEIAVPQDNRELAEQIFRAESDAAFADAAGSALMETTPEANSVNPWRMLTVLAVVAAAGAMAVESLGGRRARGAQPQRPQAESINRLLEAIREADAPYRSEPVGGGPRTRLRYNEAQGLFELAIDANADGRYESRRRFSGPSVAAAPLAR